MKSKNKCLSFLILSTSLLPIFSSCANISKEEAKIYYNFEVSATKGGSVEGTISGKYEKDYEISLLAKPENSYSFVGFYENDTLISDNSSYSFKINKDTNLVAKFIFVDIPVEQPETRIEKFAHTFKSSEIKGVKSTINGVEISSSMPTYTSQVSGKGVQIGSSTNPQLKEFTLTFSFPEEITLLNFSANIATASNGGGNVSITCADYNYSLRVNSTNNKDYEFKDINSNSDTFVFSLYSTVNKALYLHSIEFEIEVTSSSEIKLSVDNLVGQSVEPGKNGIPETKYNLADYKKDEYYSSLNLTLSGNSLRENIHSIIDNMTSYSYENAKYMLCYTDENPAKPGYLLGIFDGDDINAIWDTSWNREHVWPCAHMNIDGTKRPSASTKNHMSDLFNLRASCPSINFYHSDKYYDTSNSKNTFYPLVDSTIIDGIHNFTGDFRGDVARTVFYMYTKYLELNIIEDIQNDETTTSMGRLSALKTWHNEDPVDDFELQRNNRIYEYQGNRNPYIDYPDLVNKLF